MNFNQHSQRRKIIIIFSIVVFIECMNLILEEFYTSVHIYTVFLQMILLGATVALFRFMIKGTTEASKELSNSNQNLNSIFDSLDVAIWSHDLKSNILLITPGINKLYGHTLEEFYQDNQLWRKVIHPEDLYVLEEREDTLNSGEPCTSFYRIIRPDGRVRWIQDRGIPTIDENGILVYFTSVLFDITDRKESEDRYRSLVEMSPDIIAVLTDRKFDYINEAGSKLFGAASPSEIIGKDISSFARKEDIKYVSKKISEDWKDDLDKFRIEVSVFRLDGKSIDVEISIMPILYGGNPAIQLVGRDITTRKKAQKTIHQMAYYDSLTGLPNRNKFMQYLNETIKDTSEEPFAVLFLDLDRFKVINDTKGHSTGDMLLKKVAILLKGIIRNQGIVFRQGGDEFIIILKDVDHGQVDQFAREILHRFSQPIMIEEQEFFVTPSIGISLYPMDGREQESLLKHADTAMYVAKERGKNNYHFYDSALDQITSRKMELENGLRRALELDELRIFYQPKVQMDTGDILGVEALLRWEHPILGLISPAEFIPIAEETGLIIPIGKWVLRNAIEQSIYWENTGIGTIPVAVNISVRQIKDEDFVVDVKEILEATSFVPSCLELEITESIMQDFNRSTHVLKQLKQLGLNISMDDFGTGYSSLNNLRHLPINSIKIDKSFVDDIINFNGSIVRAIIDMAENMDFNIIAEGVETKEQVKFLLDNSCFTGQGYYFSKPLPAGDLEKYIIQCSSITAG
ncbi:sensor domain-containing protein [Falsibacillus albus]|uniref:EAL domain-containing protein n=1 Tax=Falsibacillus albus TaxID=2478915 RepID=A0A3L7JTQ4_9BACI|nr:GGDEF and EAL domain-containing protein [Falsibacillus albus]RLQ94208.1 EAL domain-containing protein [Falsibacillus albus]